MGVSKINKVPNIITIFRIICSVGLLLVKPQSAVFFIAYLMCGLSDFFDGYIARKFNISSSFGSTLDSSADMIFFGIILIIFVPIIQWTWWIKYYIGIIIIIRLTTLGIGFVKYNEISFLHTYANKITGAVVFLFPFIYYIFGLNITAIIICSIATLSAIEELIITLISKTLDKDVRGIF